jgi:uncharacterized DUF497 family protein
MKISRVIWLRQFSEKIEIKHHLSQQEVEGAIQNLVISARDANNSERKHYGKSKD